MGDLDEGEGPVALDDRDDVVRFRQRARARAASLGFGTTDQTRVMTAASELARNAVTHGRGGTGRVETVREGDRTGIRLVLEDRGPGVSDTEEAFRDGFSTGRGLGLGLSGARRLGDSIELLPGEEGGTTVRWVRWRR